MKKHPVLIAAVAVLLLGVASIAAILYTTRSEWLAWRPGTAGTEHAAGPVQAPQAERGVLVPVQPGPEPWNQTKPSPAPEWFKPGDPPHVEAAPAPVMPKKQEQRQQMELDARKQKYSSAMDALNQRAARRAGMVAPIPPSAPPAPAAYNSRRGALTTSEPAQRPGQVEQQ